LSQGDDVPDIKNCFANPVDLDQRSFDSGSCILIIFVMLLKFQNSHLGAAEIAFINPLESLDTVINALKKRLECQKGILFWIVAL
jgi:hypothetical protein